MATRATTAADILKALQRRHRVEENQINLFSAARPVTKKRARTAAAHVRGLRVAAARRRRTAARNPRLTVEQARRLVGLQRAAVRRLKLGDAPGYVTRSRAAQRLARRHRSNPRRGLSGNPTKRKKGKSMARRRRQTAAQKSAFRRMIAGLKRWRSGKTRSRKRSKTKRRTNPTRSRARRTASRALVLMTPGANMRALVANPRKQRRRRRRASNPRRHHHRGRRRRNPSGFVSAVKGAIVPVLVANAAGTAAGFADAKFFSDKPTLSWLAKAIVGLGGAAVLRRRPQVAIAFASGMLASGGYGFGLKLGGGMIAHSPVAALKGIAGMAADDPEVAALLAGLGDVTDDAGTEGIAGDDVGDAVDDYNDVLGDVTDDVGDVVESY